MISNQTKLPRIIDLLFPIPWQEAVPLSKRPVSQYGQDRAAASRLKEPPYLSRVVSGPSVEAIEELIRVRRCTPRSWRLGEVRIGRIEFAASQRWSSDLGAGRN